MKKYAFYHSAIMNNYQVINDQVLNDVLESGLLDDLDKLYICSLGSPEYKSKIKSDKIEHITVGTHIREYEFPTLKKVQEKAKSEKCYIMYFSNLGVGHSNMPTAKSWRDLISHFCVKNYKNCWKDLDEGFDVSGGEWCDLPLPHYSGTWWWAKSEYINSLMDVYQCKEKLIIPKLNSVRHRAEMWIGTNPKCKAKRNFISGYDWTNKPQLTNWLEILKNK